MKYFKNFILANIMLVLIIGISSSYTSLSVTNSPDPIPSIYSSPTLLSPTPFLTFEPTPMLSPGPTLTLKSSTSPKPLVKPSLKPTGKPSPKPTPKSTIKPKPSQTPKLPSPHKPIPVASPTSKVRIYSDEAVYDRKNKFAFVKGKVKIIQENVTIYTDEAKYDDKTKISFSEGPVKIVQLDKEQTKRETVITGKKMTVWHELKKILITEDVRLDREEDTTYKTPETKPKDKQEKQERVEKAIKKERTVITSNAMEYWTKKKDATFIGNVVVLQKDKRSSGDKAQIIDAKKTITLEGNAKVIQIKGEWLVKEKIIEKEKDDVEQDRELKEKAVITANTIEINQNTNDLIATGNVIVIQKVAGIKERVAKSDKAIYTDKNGLLTLLGNVRIEKENKDWMTADKAIIYTETETFKAYGASNKQIESEITADESPSPEPVGSSEPDFNLDTHTPAPVLPNWLKQ